MRLLEEFQRCQRIGVDESGASAVGAAGRSATLDRQILLGVPPIPLSDRQHMGLALECCRKPLHSLHPVVSDALPVRMKIDKARKNHMPLGINDDITLKGDLAVGPNFRHLHVQQTSIQIASQIELTAEHRCALSIIHDASACKASTKL